MAGGFVFDQRHYDALNAARESTICPLIESLRRDEELRTSLDIGCGVGDFSAFLRKMGFDVLALDGRQKNVEEARRRHPEMDFRVANAEDTEVRGFGKFDLMLCLGLYYHLENPFVAFRNLFAITGKVAIVEGMCIPGDEPAFAIRDEGPTEDQGLRHVALYPTENGLVKLLYRAGFSHVYRLRTMPQHPNYTNSSLSRQMRTILVAANSPLSSPLLVSAAEPPTTADPWTIRNSPAALALRARDLLARIGGFMQKPWPEKQKILHRRWTRLFPS